MENIKKAKYPHKDEYFDGVWIYDKLPPNMRVARPNELYPGKKVIYKSLIDPVEWIAETITSNRLKEFREISVIRDIYIQNV